MKSSYSQENRRTKSSLKTINITNKKSTNWKERSKRLIKATTTSLKKLEKRRRPCSNFQEKSTTSRWSLMPKRLRRTKSLSLLTLNGPSSTIPCVMSMIKELSLSKRKNNSLTRESKKSKLRSENSWLRQRSTRPMDRTSREFLNRRSRIWRKTDFQSWPRKITRFKESLKKTSKITIVWKKSKPKTVSFHTSWISPGPQSPNWTWSQERVNKKSRASIRFTRLSSNSWKRKRPPTSSTRKVW